MSLRLFQVHVHQVFVVLEDSQCPSDITITAVLCLPPCFQSILRLTASSHLSEARQRIHICWLVPLFIMHIALKYVLLMQWRVSSKATSTICGPNTHIYIFLILLVFIFFKCQYCQARGSKRTGSFSSFSIKETRRDQITGSAGRLTSDNSSSTDCGQPSR